jgi:predicted transcriptional regulator
LSMFNMSWYNILACVKLLRHDKDMNMVTFNLRDNLAELEKRTNKRFGYSDIEVATNGRISRQTARYMLNNPVARVDLETLGGIFDFFSAHGMDLTPNDLFTVVALAKRD